MGVQKECTDQGGFTMIELLIVVLIIALLTALAIPSYSSFVREARRADAQSDLIEFAGYAARIRTETNSYATAALPAASEHYTYSFDVSPSTTAFTIKATPTGDQVKDACGSMTLSHTGVKSHTGSEDDCWKPGSGS